VSGVFSYPRFQRLREPAAPLAGVAAFSFEAFSLQTGEGPVAAAGSVVSGNYFEVLGVRPARGRFFLSGDAVAGARPVAVLSWDTWRRRFAGDPAVVGREVVLNGRAVTVVGVAPRGFGGTISVLSLELWVPLEVYPQLVAGDRLGHAGHGFLQVVARMAPGATRPQARAALAARLRGGIEGGAAFGDARVEPVQGVSGRARTGVVGVGALMMGTALLVLFMASVNVVGMLLARAAVRRREVAIRLAVGAPRARLVRQLVTESLLLWVLGGGAGLLLTVWLMRAIPALLPPLPQNARLALSDAVDGRVLAFALGVSLAAGLVFGLAPALQATRTGAASGLRGGGMAEGRRGTRLREALVLGQLATAVLLMVVAGLFLRSLWHSQVVDPGFDPDGVHAAVLNLELNGYGEPRGRAFFTRLRDELRAEPGVAGVAVASSLPLDGTTSSTRVTVEGGPRVERESFDYAAVTPGYLRTLRIALVRGRDFTDADREGAPEVAIVSQTMAARSWPGQDPLGKRLRLGPGNVEVVGVARDVQDRAIGTPAEPFVYFPFAQRYSPGATILVRARGDERAAAAAVRAAVRRLDPDLPIVQHMPLRRMIVSLSPQTPLATLIGVFGAVGLLLAAVGVYGVVAYLAAQRTREIGIRMALGAARRDVLALVMGRGAWLALLGIAAGGLGALALTRVLRSLLVGVAPGDPATYATVALLLAAVVLVASYIPARRAARVDPMVALRSE
jgi:predicted permease